MLDPWPVGESTVWHIMHQSKSKKKERHIGLRMGFEVQINFELNCRTPSYSSYSNGGGAEIEVRD